MNEWVKNNIELLQRISRLRLKKQFRKPFKWIGFGVLILIFVSIIYSPISNYHHHLTHPNSYGKIKVDWYKDFNPVHLKYAKANGIKPFKKNKDFHKEVTVLMKKGELVKIKSCRNYQVERLTHSHPYLVPMGKKFLNDLGKRFQKKLDENDLGNYAFQITSLLRTAETQKSLSKSNKNASSNSSHLYGTTFDIAYDGLIKRPLPWMKVEVADPKIIKLLSEALGELRNEGRCVVVTERIEKCFHITVVK
ncbi:MAG: DUF5715 family protein [Prolixibacteraceae bacterium]